MKHPNIDVPLQVSNKFSQDLSFKCDDVALDGTEPVTDYEGGHIYGVPAASSPLFSKGNEEIRSNKEVRRGEQEKEAREGVKRKRVKAQKNSDLQQQIRSAEDDDANLCEYERVRLGNMRERQVLLDNLNMAASTSPPSTTFHSKILPAKRSKVSRDPVLSSRVLRPNAGGCYLNTSQPTPWARSSESEDNSKVNNA